MSRIRVAVVAALSPLLIIAAAAPALAAIRFTSIHYDSGSTSLTNYNINKEFVTIKNTGTHRRHLGGWRLVDVRSTGNLVYHFPSHFYLRPGTSVRVHSGKGTRSRTDLYWGLSHFVWNNDSAGDTAYLRNSSGTLIDRCSYTPASDPSPASC